MDGLKTRVRKFFYFLRHDVLVFDNLVLVIAVILCLFWTGGAITSMSRNWTLSEEVSTRRREQALLELEVETLSLENTYYSSKEYQELSARKYQNKMLEGETMIYLPANSEAARTKHAASVAASESEPEQPLTNFESWLAFLFGV